MEPDDIDMIEAVDDQWYVFVGRDGSMLTPDQADEIALAFIRMADAVRRKNG